MAENPWLDTVKSEYAKQGQSITQADMDYWGGNQNLTALQNAFAANKPATQTPAVPSATDFTKQIADTYKNAGGYAGDKAGVDWWSQYASSGKNANWLDELTGSLKADATKASTTGLKNAQNLLGFTGNVWDNAALSEDQRKKLILESYRTDGGMAPDQEGMNRWLQNFDVNFNDYSFADDWTKIYSDPEGRKNSLALRGEQEVYGFAEALAEMMGKAPAGGPGTAPAAGGGGIGDYMNPFLEAVLNPSLRKLGDATTMQRNALGSGAFAAGAYGDGRHGVESQGLTDDYLENVGDLSSQLFGQGYESGMNWKNVDLDRQMQTAFRNADLENAWFGNQLNAASTGSNIANNSAGLGFQYADMLTGLDSYDRDWLQQDLNSQYEDFWGKQNWDANQLAQFASIIGGVPGQTGEKASTPSNMWASILGSLTSNPNLFGNLGR